jgi:hypothetical protein
LNSNSNSSKQTLPSERSTRARNRLFCARARASALVPACQQAYAAAGAAIQTKQQHQQHNNTMARQAQQGRLQVAALLALLLMTLLTACASAAPPPAGGFIGSSSGQIGDLMLYKLSFTACHKNEGVLMRFWSEFVSLSASRSTTPFFSNVL